MMKSMKKVLCTVLIIAAALSMTACAKEKTTVLTFENGGVSVEYKFDAKGDIIQTITMTSNMDCTAYSEEEVATIEASITEFEALYDAYEGAAYTYEITDSLITEEIILDVSDNELVQNLSDAGLLPIEGESSSLSLKKTVENLTAQGWVEQTAE